MQSGDIHPIAHLSKAFDMGSNANSKQAKPKTSTTSTPQDEYLRLARHSTDLNVDMDLLPTLLSPHIASFITTFAASTRVSLRVAVFLIESFLETSQFSTRVSLTYARRFLISALSFARHAHTYHLYHGIVLPESTDAFMLALDKYTAVGIHVVQHTFSLVELFTMSGFYLTATAIQSAAHAAEESVTLLDGLFGSTQSSRALAAIIEMVRKELDMEDRIKGKNGKKKGMLGGMAMLTKAITAFACLQVATWERTRGKSKMIQIHDYLVRPDAPIPNHPMLASDQPDSPLSPSQSDLRQAEEGRSTVVSPDRLSHPPTPCRPKRKRSQTTRPPSCISHSGSSSSAESTVSFDDPVIPSRTPKIRRDRYLRSRSLDLTRDLTAALTLGATHGRASTAPTSLNRPATTSSTRGVTVDSESEFPRQCLCSPPSSPTLNRRAPVFQDHMVPRPPVAPGKSMSLELHGVSHRDDSTSYGRSKKVGCFPRRHLLQNLHRFMKYSAAAYGQMFLRVFGTGTSDYAFPSTAQHHSNSWAFAQYTGIPIDCLLLTSYVDASPVFDGHKAPPLVHFVAVDHAAEAIVLTCRGTLGLSDILVDLTCEYRTISVDHADAEGEYFVHEGMHEAALGLCAQDSRVHRTIAEALAQYPSYGLIICGHSLGGGVAALLALLTSIPASSYATATPTNSSSKTSIGQFVTSPASGLPPGRPVHCFAYGPPAVMSPDLARYAEGLVSSIIQDTDLIPSLSLGTLRDLKNIAVTMSEESGLAEEVFSRVVGMHKNPLFGDAKPPDADSLADWLVALASTLRADMHNDKLYPPGTVYVMEVNEVLSTVGAIVTPNSDNSAYRSHRAILRKCTSVEERFREPIFARTMLNDHLPSNYERSTHLLLKGMMQEEEEDR